MTERAYTNIGPKESAAAVSVSLRWVMSMRSSTFRWYVSMVETNKYRDEGHVKPSRRAITSSVSESLRKSAPLNRPDQSHGFRRCLLLPLVHRHVNYET